MDDDEDPFGKISRQFSERAAAPSTPVSTGLQTTLGQEDGGQWTQFSGISPQRPLYSWNATNLPDCKTASTPKMGVSGEPSTGASSYTSRSPPITGLNNEFNFQRQFEVKTPDAAQRFQVSGDLGGRFVSTQRGRSSSMNTENQQHGFVNRGFSLGETSVFTGDNLLSRPTTNVTSASQPSSPYASQLSRNARFGSYSAQASPESYHHDNPGLYTDRSINQPLFSQENTSLSNVIPPSFRFDPSTPPPPLYPMQNTDLDKSINEAYDLSNHFKKSNEDSPLQGTPGINIDLGTNIGSGSYVYADPTSTVTAGDEGRDLYEAALSQWKSSTQSNKQDAPSLGQCQLDLQSGDMSKKSYSDIAKTPKTAAASGKPNPVGFGEFDVKSEIASKIQGKKPVLKKEGKPFRHMKRSLSGSKYWPKGSLSGEIDQPSVSPTSRYGLDNFDDQVLSAASSSESLATGGLVRRSSESSAGSSAGVLEDPSSRPSSATLLDSTDPHAQSSSETLKPTKDSQTQSTSKSLFFDPRRIFQAKNTNKSRVQSTNQKNKGVSTSRLDEVNSAGDTVLNNGKPNTGNSSSKLSSSARQHDYINNDLRDSSKLTNQAAAETSQHTHSKRDTETRSGMGKKASGRSNNGLCRRKKPPDVKRSQSQEDNNDNDEGRNKFSFIYDHMDIDKIEEWCGIAVDQFKVLSSVVLATMMNLLVYVLGVVLFLASGGVQLSMFLVSKGWVMLRCKFLRWQGSGSGQGWSSRDLPRKRVGLEENIVLPSTGEEAMKRLLACKGKDPYSILGLRSDSSDEDIKKYYRKQAVLVHPDKNQEPGAEEAFKILGHAFEMIGEPSKRKQYDSHTQEANEAEQMREFAEMFSKLQTKLQEAANMMHCDNCGGKHRRLPVDRPFYSARFCQRCNIHHSAKEGDVWAESKMLGFYWHYYALMEGRVFDITEWMKCHKEFFQHMKANTHGVSYRIATDGNKRNRNQHHNSGHNDTNWEELINRLFNKASAGTGDTSQWASSGNGDMNWGSQPTTGAASSTNAKKNRRRKKR